MKDSQLYQIIGNIWLLGCTISIVIWTQFLCLALGCFYIYLSFKSVKQEREYLNFIGGSITPEEVKAIFDGLK